MLTVVSLMTSVASFPYGVVCFHHSSGCLRMCRRRDRRDQIRRDVLDSCQQRFRNVSLGHIIARLLDLLCVFWPLRSSRIVFSIGYRCHMTMMMNDRVDIVRCLDSVSRECLSLLVFLKEYRRRRSPRRLRERRCRCRCRAGRRCFHDAP